MSKLLADQMIPMRDRIFLATDIYLPDRAEFQPVPLVLERTPYNKEAHSRSEITKEGHKISRAEMAQAFNQIGIAVAYQDCRGRYKSQGVFTKYLNEAEDGFDTLEWLAQQDWCNGDIGTMGLSYAAHTQLALACLNPPNLRTMVLDSGGFFNAYQCGIRQGGAFELKQATWAFKQAKNSPQAQSNPQIQQALKAQNIHYWFNKMPWIAGHSPLSSLPEYEDYLLEQWQNGRFDQYWQKIGIYAQGYFDSIPDIPVLCMSSWYDSYVSSTLDNFTQLRNSKKSPQTLIMGSWLHGDRNIAHSGDVYFGEKAYFDGNLAKSWLDYRLAWFKQYLLKQPQPQKSSVNIFVMGGGTGQKTADNKLDHGGFWLQDENWPPSNSQREIWYCQPNMQLSQKLPSTSLLALQADSNHPIPTIGGSITSGKPVYVGGAFDQRERADFFATDGTNHPLSARQDILTFQTEILTEDLFIAGEVEVVVYLKSDAPDFDICAKLIDVYPANEDYPEGFAMNLTDGIFRARYRHSWRQPELVKKDEIVCLKIRPFATANLFKKGHRIRLDLAGSNFPHFDCNPNSGEPEGQARHKRIANHQIFIGGKQATHICLQVVKI